MILTQTVLKLAEDLTPGMTWPQRIVISSAFWVVATAILAGQG
jgi:hypothetical protein